MWDDFDYIAEADKHGGIRAAVRASGIPYTTFYRNYDKQKKASALNKLGLKNIRAMDEAMPDNHDIKGTSTLYDAEGNKRLVWVKTNASNDTSKEHLEAIGAALMSDIEPLYQPKPYTHISSTNLCSLYVVSDFHMGQYSSKSETGEAWDLEIAERTFKNWFTQASHAAPYSRQAILCDLGDMLHADSFMPVTPTSKHVLDASGRFHEAVEAAVRCFDHAIGVLLEKHTRVHVIIAQGNHDLSTAHLLARMIARRYENEERLTFDMSVSPYYAFEWGQTSLFFHHGHRKRISDVSRTLAAQFRDIFGRTKYSYAHVGHLHHRDLKEDSLMVVEQHSTLAAKDAHSAGGGYHSERGASVITYHREHGEVARATIRPEVIE